MDVLASINHSITLITRLREISKSLSEAESKNLLADLSNELANAKIRQSQYAVDPVLHGARHREAGEDGYREEGDLIRQR